MRCLLTAAARADLEQIIDYLAPRSPAGASSVLQAVEERIGLLCEHPHAGRSREELSPGLRSAPVGSYLLFYLVREQDPVIVRVLHGARDIDALF